MQITRGAAKQRIARRGFIHENVEGRAGDMAAVERLAQRCFIHEAAARAIDDAHAFSRLGEAFRRQNVAGLRGQRRVQRDELRARQQFVEFHLLDAERHRALGGEEGVEGDDAHLQSQGARGDNRADIAAADDAESLAGDLHAHEAAFFPFARLRRGVGGGNVARQREHQRYGVLGRRDRIAEGRVHHDDAARGRGGNVDIVDADAGASDDPKTRGLRQYVGGHPCRGANRQTIVIANDGGELFLVLAERRLKIDIDAPRLENLDRGGGELIGDEDARRHFLILAKWL